MSISRVPPPKTGISMTAGVGERLVCPGDVPLDAGVEHLGPGGRGPHGSVRVDADEQIGLVVVGERCAGVERHGGIAVAREEDARAESRLERRLDAPRNRERDVLLERPLRPGRARLGSAVARIDHDRAQARRSSTAASARPPVAARPGSARGGGKSAAARTRRSPGAKSTGPPAYPRRGSCRTAGPARSRSTARSPPARTACTQPSEANAGSVASIGVRALEADDQPARLLRHRVRRRRRDVEHEPGAVAGQLVVDRPRAARAGRPRSSSRDPLRSSSFVSVMSASARGMNSTGTYHRPPITRMGAAGSDTRRPATDAIDCSGVRTMVLPRAVTVIARASVSSRTAHLEAGRELVERDHLDVVDDARSAAAAMPALVNSRSGAAGGFCPARREPTTSRTIAQRMAAARRRITTVPSSEIGRRTGKSPASGHVSVAIDPLRHGGAR